MFQGVGLVSRLRIIVIGLLTVVGMLATASGTFAQATSTGSLLASGSGNLQTVPFTSSGGKLLFCWNVSGQSPSGVFGPSAAFFIKSSATGTIGPSFDSDQGSQQCSPAAVPAGTYFVQVVATPWTLWSITITPQ
jgi:hypothetical protein